MRYATFDDAGLPIGFYAENVHGARVRPTYGHVPRATEEDPNPVAPVIGDEPNPNCVIPTNAVEITDEQWLEFLSYPGLRKWHEGEVIAYAPAPPTPTVADYQAAIQTMIDQAAISKQFNDGVTLASYANSTNPEWKQQAIDFIAWRDAVWAFVYQQLALVEAGGRIQPTVADFLLELPAVTWSVAA